MNTDTPTDLTVLDALDRMTLTRLGRVIEAKVASRHGYRTYRVRIDGDRWACSCPTVRYRGQRADPCKHVRALAIVARTLPEMLGGVAA